MATPAYIRARIGEGVIKCVNLSRFSDGYSCVFVYNDKDKKPLYPSTGAQPTRVWKTYKDVLDYVKQQIGWTGPIYNEHLEKIQ